MKIRDIIVEAEGELGTRLTEKELNFIFEIVENNGIIDASEVTGIVNEYLVDYSRNKNSLRMAVVRAHVLVHSVLPLNMVPNATWYSKIPQEMQLVSIDRGHDPYEAVELAKADAQERSKLVKEPKAREMMADEYMANKEKYSLSIRKHRDTIIQDIMKGATAQEAMMAFTV